MKNILIVGAGGLAREIYSWLKSDERYGIEWSVKGFLDKGTIDLLSKDDPIRKYDLPVFDMEHYHFETNDICILGIGNSFIKERIVEELISKNVELLTYIHPSAIIAEHVRVGKGTIICPNVIISCDSVIGSYVTVSLASTIGHDVVIGDYVTLSSHVDVTGNCCLKEGVFMGSHATLVPGTTVGEYATIAAGSVGIRKVKAQTTILGVPGKKFEIKVK
ncbi:NeuD/PglB/VioB family sugar acetyltransferase [Lysinibacillus sphaericus]|uniref:NeuD/PglB/VioB family sugar acetyltransferase n=1 Tax=Lysinibacillus sphaericus TaxID=1421 RepID=UPI0006921200|nr:NeuD/PglB/VioB family sugar acetyltransferase [Lysinibacillus sphaericus]